MLPLFTTFQIRAYISSAAFFVIHQPTNQIVRNNTFLARMPAVIVNKLWINVELEKESVVFVTWSGTPLPGLHLDVVKEDLLVEVRSIIYCPSTSTVTSLTSAMNWAVWPQRQDVCWVHSEAKTNQECQSKNYVLHENQNPIDKEKLY